MTVHRHSEVLAAVAPGHLADHRGQVPAVAQETEARVGILQVAHPGRVEVVEGHPPQRLGQRPERLLPTQQGQHQMVRSVGLGRKNLGGVDQPPPFVAEVGAPDLAALLLDAEATSLPAPISKR